MSRTKLEIIRRDKQKPTWTTKELLFFYVSIFILMVILLLEKTSDYNALKSEYYNYVAEKECPLRQYETLLEKEWLFVVYLKYIIKDGVVSENETILNETECKYFEETRWNITNNRCEAYTSKKIYKNFTTGFYNSTSGNITCLKEECIIWNTESCFDITDEISDCGFCVEKRVAYQQDFNPEELGL